MDWYIPISLLPGIALIILSTSNFIVAVNKEVQHLKMMKEKYNGIIMLKTKQLKRLSYSITQMYISVLLFTVAGLISSLFQSQTLLYGLMILGICVFTMALILLIIYAIKAIKIRDTHLKISE